MDFFLGYSIIASSVCFIFTLVCGYWAAEFALKGEAPQHEFVCKQLTAGAWLFGMLTVVILVGAGFFAATNEVYTTPTTQEVTK